MLQIYDLKTEYRTNPMGIDEMHPRFSWKLRCDERDVHQNAWQIRVFCEEELMWDSGINCNCESQHIRYDGKTLVSGQQLQWEVSVWANDRNVVSKRAFFEMGLLSERDWQAIWIQPEKKVDYDRYKPAAYLRKTFHVASGLVRARIYQSAHGLYEFFINGKRGTEDRFNPGLTSYHHRIQYQTYDILPFLQQGENVWAVQLGDGWWRGNTGGGNRNNFGFFTSFIGQIILEYKDGTRQIVATDEQFQVNTGAILRCDMKVGEVYDARKELAGWKKTGYSEEGWTQVVPATEFACHSTLIPSRSVPVREKEKLQGIPFKDAAGNTVIDFGQNHAGYVYMRLRNTMPGQRIILTHGEGLCEGVFSQKNLEETSKDPMQVIEYICKGEKEEVYHPTFSVFGYRYVKIEGYEEPIFKDDFISVAVYSDMEEAGTFTCSNSLINKLVENSKWSMKSNFLDAPTDCPTRERSTWTGDAQVYAKTATDFMGVYPFFEKWLLDLNEEQFEDGCVGNTIPSTNALHNAEERQRMLEQHRFVFAPPTMAGPAGNGDMLDGAAGWGDAATIIPYTMYLCYGDRKILEQQYESAAKWVDFCRKNAKMENPLYQDQEQYHCMSDGVLDAEYIYDTHFHWGEWLEPGSAETGGSQAFNPIEMKEKGNPIVATAYLYYSNILMAKMAEVLGKEEIHNYETYAAHVKRVYNKYFIGEDGTILSGKQAPYVRALHFGLVNDNKKQLVAAQLAKEVEKSGYTLNTGFLSTPFLLEELIKYGYKEHAFRLLEQTEYPSWLHSVILGATTTLENWDGMDTFRASFNHYSYGAVCDFLVSQIAGIQALWDYPGYTRFRIEPCVGGTLTWAQASMESLYGKISVRWERKEKHVQYEVEIPVNTTAEICLPVTDIDVKKLKAKYDGKIREDKLIFTIGSGKYIFV